MSCSCNSKVSKKLVSEIDSENPVLVNFKKNLKAFSKSVSEFKQTSDGKSIPGKYWQGIEDLLKKSKLGIAMIELGIDLDDDSVSGSELNITPMGDTRDGDQQLDNKEAEDEEGGEEGGDAEAPAPEGGDANKEAPAPEGGDANKEAPAPEGDDADKEASSGEEEKPTDKDEESEDEVSTDPNPESYREGVNEKSKSASQQRLFGMVHAYNNDELEKDDTGSDLYDKIKKIAGDMKQKDVEKLAKTKHDDLPEKVPTDEIHDIANHLTILLSEANLQELGDAVINDAGFSINLNFKNENYNLTFLNKKFLLVSDDYTYDIGENVDLSEVVNKLTFLLNNLNENLIKDDNPS